MKKTVLLSAFFLFVTFMVNAQNCPEQTCECEGEITEVQLYFFSDDMADIDVYSDADQNNLITSFNNVSSGDLLTVSAAGLPNGIFPYYNYYHIQYNSGDECTVRIFSRCPTNAWPNALEELQTLGKTYGDLTVYAYTSSENNTTCDMSSVEQDWRVGGNIVAPDNMKFGTRNDESVSIITNDQPRGVITNNGAFGLGTDAPTAVLHVGGDAQVDETLDVLGVTTVQDNTTSTDATNGALVVTGGAGIGENANIGSDLSVGGEATVTGNLTVESGGLTTLANADQSNDPASGALTVAGGVGVGLNLNVGENLQVGIDAHIDGITTMGTFNTPPMLGGEDLMGYHLFVAGGILTEEVLVRTGWADYVFHKNYPLRSLEETEQFIKENGHLPDMPSEEEVERKGLALAENAVDQQVKIEEIYLHLIEMNKQLKDLQAENEKLKAKVKELENQ